MRNTADTRRRATEVTVILSLLDETKRLAISCRLQWCERDVCSEFYVLVEVVGRALEFLLGDGANSSSNAILLLLRGYFL